MFATYNTANALLTLNLAVWFLAVVCIDVSSLESLHTQLLSEIICGFVAVIPLFYASGLSLQLICSTFSR